MTSGQERHWLIKSPTIVHLYQSISVYISLDVTVTRLSGIVVNFVFKHIHAASIYTICRLYSIHLLSSVRRVKVGLNHILLGDFHNKGFSVLE